MPKSLTFYPHLLSYFFIFSDAICNRFFVFFDLFNAFSTILIQLFFRDYSFDVVNHSLWFLNRRIFTLRDLIRVWAYVSMLRTESYMIVNFPVRFSLLVELRIEPETIDDPVLLNNDDCIWAYLVLFISSTLLMFM